LTLAGAFEKSNNQKHDFLRSHIEWEKEKFNKQDDRERDRFEWEKQQFKEEKKEQLAKVEKQKQEDQSTLEIRRGEIALEQA
jgi:hypothetical protein